MGRRNYGLELNLRWYRAFGPRWKHRHCALQLPLYCRQPFPGKQADHPSAFTMEFGSFALLRSGAVSENEFALASPGMIERELVRTEAFLLELLHREVRPVVLLFRSFKSHYAVLGPFVTQHHAGVRSLCRRLGVACCVGEDLSSSAFHRRGLMLDETHPDEYGNACLARRVFAALFAEEPVGRFPSPQLRVEIALRQCARYLARGASRSRARTRGKGVPPDRIYPLW